VTGGAKSRDDNVGKEETPTEKSMGMTCGMWMQHEGNSDHQLSQRDQLRITPSIQDSKVEA
jgi:hypothetical protein